MTTDREDRAPEDRAPEQAEAEHLADTLRDGTTTTDSGPPETPSGFWDPAADDGRGAYRSWDDVEHEYAQNARQLIDLKEQAETIRERQDLIGPRLLERWMTTRRRSLKIDGVGTLHLQRQGWAKVIAPPDVDATEARQRACRALERAGLGDLVNENFNTHTLSARYRQWAKDRIDPPEELDGIIRFDVDYDLRLRRT
jgi:hypothetical protein